MDRCQAKLHTFLDDGERVAAFGGYSGTHDATGKSFAVTFAHLCTLRDDKIASMEHYVDSATVRVAMK